MVMPRSRSSSFESRTRSATASLARNVPLCLSMASTRVVLPWSTWAMMAMLRMLEDKENSSFRVYLHFTLRWVNWSRGRHGLVGGRTTLDRTARGAKNLPFRILNRGALRATSLIFQYSCGRITQATFERAIFDESRPVQAGTYDAYHSFTHRDTRAEVEGSF